jgi:hypothetical protein
MNYQHEAVCLNGNDNNLRSDVLIFCTSLNNSADVQKIAPFIKALQEVKSWSVDLEDCDRVLRLVSPGLDASIVIKLLKRIGVSILEMED